jgi:DNA-binding MarR family transcriptional regulator
MLDKNSNASRLIEKLKDKHLIERNSCPSDRRQVEVLITEEGLQLLSELDEIVQKMEENAVNLTDAESQQLNYLLDKIRTTPDITQ